MDVVRVVMPALVDAMTALTPTAFVQVILGVAAVLMLATVWTTRVQPWWRRRTLQAGCRSLRTRLEANVRAKVRAQEVALPPIPVVRQEFCTFCGIDAAEGPWVRHPPAGLDRAPAAPTTQSAPSAGPGAPRLPADGARPRRVINIAAAFRSAEAGVR